MSNSPTVPQLHTLTGTAAAIGVPISNLWRAVASGRITADFHAGAIILFAANRLAEIKAAMSAKVAPHCRACGSPKPARNGRCPTCSASFAQRQGQQPVAKLRAAAAGGPCAKCGNTAPPTINPRVCRACGAPR